MSYPVQLYVYDLSNGLAKSVSLSLTGIHIEGIWHTSVVVYDQEIFFGQGISIVKPGSTHHGQPLKTVDLGTTDIPPEVFFEYLEELKGTYTAEKYHLLDFNCNNFSNEVVGFLNGGEIPSYIKSLPAEFLSTPFGRMIRPQIDSFFGAGRSQTSPLNSFGTIDPATILSGLTSQANAQSSSQATTSNNNVKAEVVRPSSLEDLQTLIKESTMLVVIVEIPDCKTTSSTQNFIERMVASYASSLAVKEKFPTFTIPKIAVVTSERVIPKDRVEDQQSVIVQFFSKGVEVNRTNNFSPSVIRGCFEFAMMKNCFDETISNWDSSLATINKTPKLFVPKSSKDEFVEALPSVASSLSSSDVNSIWDSIATETFEFSLKDESLFASELISILKQLEEQSDTDTLKKIIVGLSYLVRHPKVSSSLATSANIQALYSSLLKLFLKNELQPVKEGILSLCLNMFSSHLGAQISSSLFCPLTDSKLSPLNQLTQIIVPSLLDDQLKFLAIQLSFNLILHISQSSLLPELTKDVFTDKISSELTTNLLNNFFELEDGEIWAMEFFSVLAQSLSSLTDVNSITCLVETLVISHCQLSLTSSRTIIPALAQSLEFSVILNQKVASLDLDDKPRNFLTEATKFITESQ